MEYKSRGMLEKQVKVQRVEEALFLLPTDTLLHLIQIRVSKTGWLNLQASQQYRGHCQLQSLSLHAHSVIIPPVQTSCHQQLSTAHRPPVPIQPRWSFRLTEWTHIKPVQPEVLNQVVVNMCAHSTS